MPLDSALHSAYKTVFSKNKKYNTLLSGDVELYNAMTDYAQIVADQMVRERSEVYQSIIKDKDDIIAELQHEV